MIYGNWNIWKARNKKVFEKKKTDPRGGVAGNQFEMQCRCRSSARGSLELSSFNA